MLEYIVRTKLFLPSFFFFLLKTRSKLPIRKLPYGYPQSLFIFFSRCKECRSSRAFSRIFDVTFFFIASFSLTLNNSVHFTPLFLFIFFVFFCFFNLFVLKKMYAEHQFDSFENLKMSLTGWIDSAKSITIRLSIFIEYWNPSFSGIFIIINFFIYTSDSWINYLTFANAE